MQVDSPPAPSTPLILDNLPDPKLPTSGCPRRTRIELDLLLLAIEALDIQGSQAILGAIKQLSLQEIISSRVQLWLLRGSNPLRRSSQRRPLSLLEAKALTVIICHLARRLTVLIRQLLLGWQQLSDKELSAEHHFRLAAYLKRFRAHFRARMNPGRAAVIAYDADDKLDELAIALLTRLLFCTGTQGPQRLWSSLFDGEVL